MPETTPVLGLQLTAASQAQKHVTVNEALLKLDALVHLSVIERNRNAPPASPANGDRYIVGASPTGAFAGKTGCVASYDAGVWTFMTPRAGWRAYVVAETGLLVFNGGTWSGFSPTGPIQNIDLLGVGATADAINPLSVRANNALFAARSTPSGTGDMRFKLNKDTAANTLSFLFQDNFSGRAEIGLIGDDNLTLKVSSDGATWRNSLVVAPATGKVTFPNGASRRFLKRTVFTASGTWTRAATTSFAISQVIGGGGGGATNSSGPTGSGGGGGGGGYSCKEIAAPGATETVTIGAGGAGATAVATSGSAGGTSSFGTHHSATGGQGGTRADYGGAGGAGGIGSGGDINLPGNPGGPGTISGYWYPPGGGAGGTGGGGGSNLGPAAQGGGGGSGTPQHDLNPGRAGGAGLVIVDEYE